MAVMNSRYQGKEMKEAIVTSFMVLSFILLCLDIKTAFAVPSSVKQKRFLSYNVKRLPTSMTTQIKVLPDFENVHEPMGVSSTYRSLSTEVVITNPTGTPETNVRHLKRKLRAEREKTRKAITKREKDKKSRRKRERHRHLRLKQKSCPTRTNYVSKRTAEDIFGNTVAVYPVIYIGKLALDQLFYESFCAEERCSCVGVNNKKFSSSCQTTHSYTYARIVKGGEIGWSYIKVRSGCSCVIQKKRNRGVFLS